MSTQRTSSFLGTISSKLKRGTVTSASSFGSFGDSPLADVSGHVSLRQLGRKASSHMFGSTGTAAASDAAAGSVIAYDSGELRAHDKAFFANSTATAAGASIGSAFESAADSATNTSTSSSRQRQLSLLLQSQSHSRQLSSRQPNFDLTGDMPLILRVNSSDNSDHLVSSASSSTSAPQRVGLSSLRKASSSIYSSTGSMVSATTTTSAASAATAAATAASDSAADRRDSTLQHSLSAALLSIVASRSRAPSFLRSGSFAVGANSNSSSNSVGNTTTAAVHGALPRVSIANLRSCSRTGSVASLVDTAHSNGVSAGDSSEELLQRSSSRSGSILASIKRMSVRSMSSMFSASQLHGGAGNARQSISETDFDDQVSKHLHSDVSITIVHFVAVVFLLSVVENINIRTYDSMTMLYTVDVYRRAASFCCSSGSCVTIVHTSIPSLAAALTAYYVLYTVTGSCCACITAPGEHSCTRPTAAVWYRRWWQH
jgi:hypothetical protein